MAVTSVAGLELIAKESVFIQILQELQNQINELIDKKNQYFSLRNRIDDVWTTSDGESETYRQAIDDQLNNIDLTLESVQSAFEEFGKLNENLRGALNSVKGLADTVADQTKQLFV